MKIGYLGIPGSFSHTAASQMAGSDDSLVGTASFRQLFTRLADGACNSVVIPIENSLAGSIHENYDLLGQYPVQIIREHRLHVRHHLCAVATGLETIRKVSSHPKAIEQCEQFLLQHPDWAVEYAADTANAARNVRESDDQSLAAICSQAAAEIYQLKVLAHDIQSDALNYTRFFMLSPHGVEPESADKCVLLFTLPHIPRSLYRAFGILMEGNVNVSKIESRPIVGQPFEYMFCIEFEFDPQARNEVNSVLGRFQEFTTSCKVLGFFAKPQGL